MRASLQRTRLWAAFYLQVVHWKHELKPCPCSAARISGAMARMGRALLLIGMLAVAAVASAQTPADDTGLEPSNDQEGEPVSMQGALHTLHENTLACSEQRELCDHDAVGAMLCGALSCSPYCRPAPSKALLSTSHLVLCLVVTRAVNLMSCRGDILLPLLSEHGGPVQEGSWARGGGGRMAIGILAKVRTPRGIGAIPSRHPNRKLSSCLNGMRIVARLHFLHAARL